MTPSDQRPHAEATVRAMADTGPFLDGVSHDQADAAVVPDAAPPVPYESEGWEEAGYGHGV